MTDQLAIMLEWFANYSNFYSIMSVLVCFCAMVVFILRLNGENLMGSSATHYAVVREQKMVSLHNPFSVQLGATKPSSVKDGLHLDITVTHAARSCVAWGVDIQAFQQELSNPTSDIAANFRDKKLFNNSYLHLTDLSSLCSAGQVLEVRAPCPDSLTEASLGEPPRRVYPVVSVSLLDEPATDYAGIVVQFTVFHLKDSVCTLDSHIVYQFVKTNHDKILTLQPIFVVSSEPDTTDSKSTSPSQSTDTAATSTTSAGTGDSQSTSSSNGPATSPVDVVDVAAVSSDTADTSTPSTGAGDSSNPQACDNCVHENHSDNSNTHDSDNMKESTENCDNHHEPPHDANGNVNSDIPDYAGLDDSNCCIVCQSAVIFYTLLPCRHACVCGACMRQLERCPMCRGYIDAYFRLHDLPDDTDIPEAPSTEGAAPVLSRWEIINNRVNEFLGFS